MGSFFRPMMPTIHYWGHFFTPRLSMMMIKEFVDYFYSLFVKMEEPTKEKKEYIHTRCAAKTKAGRVCRRNREADCLYCYQHTEMTRVTIPVYRVMTDSFVTMDDLKPCPMCCKNITCGEPCAPCSNYIAY